MTSGFGLFVNILIFAIPAAIALIALYWVIRFAVGSALRNHQLWLDTRNSPRSDPHT